MKSRVIGFWHGKTKDLEKIISKFCRYDSDAEHYMWSGSLDEFERLYNDKFIVFSDVIYVTHKGSWSQS